MARPPTLKTERLKLRPFITEDAEAVTRLAGAREVADTTLHIPHPYQLEDAYDWFNSQEVAFERGDAVHFAIERREDGELIGAIGLHVNRDHQYAEMGYWIGVAYWNQGYCTEAARRAVAYAFKEMGLNRIQARHFRRNPASGKVMQKIGMQREGTLRKAVKKWEQFQDLELYSILRSEWEEHR